MRNLLSCTVALACFVALPSAAGAAISINNGLAPPNPANVIDASNSFPSDDVHVENAGCDQNVSSPCALPGDPTTVALVSGGVARRMFSRQSSSIEMRGGHAHGLYSYESSFIEMSEGWAGHLGAFFSSSILVRGGSFTTLGAYHGATITVVGSGFAVDAVPVPFGDLTAMSGTLTGTLQSGEALDVPFNRFTTGTISLVPGPNVTIDVQPRDPENRILAKPHVPILVAILGSAEVDVRDVDVTTLAFGPGRAAPALDLTYPVIYSLSLGDVNRDGEDDLMATFFYGEAELPLGESEACVTGEIADVQFEGCDTVAVFLPGCGVGFELAFLLPPLMWLYEKRRSKRA